jgi:hypothetical protein
VFAAQQAADYRDREPVPPLDEETREFAAAWNRHAAQAIRRSRIEVTGDLGDLVPRPDPSAARPLLPPPDDEVLLAAQGVATTLDLLPPGPVPERQWSDLDAAVAGIVERMAAIIAAGGVDRLSPRGTEMIDDE